MACQKFIGGVVDTGDIIFSWCRRYRSEITKKPKSFYWCQVVNDTAEKLFTGVNETFDKFFGGVIDIVEQLITCVVDIGDKHSFANISANKKKTSKRPQWNTWGAEGQ